MRQIVIVIAATALVTAIVAIWATTVIIDHTQMRPDAALAASSVDLMHKIEDAKHFADENAAPVD
jgi:hypothetical protein